MKNICTVLVAILFTTNNFAQAGTNDSFAPYSVNNFYPDLGGYVLEVSEDGTSGLVLAMQDQGYSNWYEASDLLNNNLNFDLHSMRFKDWRIPTKRELNLMYNIYINGNGANLNGYVYWSSTDGDFGAPWRQSFTSGFQKENYTLKSYHVRAVRSFDLGELKKTRTRLTRREAITRLKESKELLDLGILTQKEFDTLRIELTPIIINE